MSFLFEINIYIHFLGYIAENNYIIDIYKNDIIDIY